MKTKQVIIEALIAIVILVVLFELIFGHPINMLKDLDELSGVEIIVQDYENNDERAIKINDKEKIREIEKSLRWIWDNKPALFTYSSRYQIKLVDINGKEERYGFNEIHVGRCDSPEILKEIFKENGL